jgi:hypothetical protein
MEGDFSSLIRARRNDPRTPLLLCGRCAVVGVRAVGPGVSQAAGGVGAAVERNDWTDPYEQRLPAMGSPCAMLAGMQHEQAEAPGAGAGLGEVAT